MRAIQQFLAEVQNDRVATARLKPSDSALLERLRQNLRLKVLYDEAKIDRLIDLERRACPNASMRQLMEAAIERWETDNR